MHAMEMALRDFVGVSKGEEHPRAAFLGDCQSAITATMGYISHDAANFPVASRSRQHIRELDDKRHAEIKIDWIPAHCNIAIGDKADQLAKQAALLSRSQKYHEGVRVPMGTFRLFLRAAEAQVQQRWWVARRAETEKPRQRSTGSSITHLFGIHPVARNKVPPELHQGLPRTDQVALERLYVGSAMHNGHLRKLGHHPTGDCDHCQGIPDRVDHRILSCQGVAEARDTLKAELDRIGVPLSLPTLVGLNGVKPDERCEVRAALLKFLHQSNTIKLFADIRE